MSFAHTYLRGPRVLFKGMFQRIEQVLRQSSSNSDNETRKRELEEKLSLFHYTTCVFCLQVRLELESLGLQIEKKDIDEDKKSEQELLLQGGKIQVPCLKIISSDGPTQYLYESSSIITYLRKSLSSNPDFH